MRLKLLSGLVLAGVSALAAAQTPAPTFVLDLTFGSNGVATYEWPASMGYDWNATDVWATRLHDGRWAVMTQLRDGNSQIGQVNWFDPDGTVTPSSPGHGPYSPFGLGGWNMAGIGTSHDGTMTIASSFPVTPGNHDYRLWRTRADGQGEGYTGCAGGAANSIPIDMAPPNYMDDLARAMVIDGDGRTLLAGTARAGATTTHIVAARARPDCFLDSTFGSNHGRTVIAVPDSRGVRVHTAALRAGSRLVIGGGYSRETGNTPDGRCILARLGPDGRHDPDFGNDGIVRIGRLPGIEGSWRCDIRHIAFDRADRLYVAGDWQAFGGSHNQRNVLLMRVNYDGRLDASFAGNPGIGSINVSYRSGGLTVLHMADKVISAVTTHDEQSDYAKGNLSVHEMNSGVVWTLPFVDSLDPLPREWSTAYHRILRFDDDNFFVLATSGPDRATHHKTHIIRYRRASTIPEEPTDRIFASDFETPRPPVPMS